MLSTTLELYWLNKTIYVSCFAYLPPLSLNSMNSVTHKNSVYLKWNFKNLWCSLRCLQDISYLVLLTADRETSRFCLKIIVLECETAANDRLIDFHVLCILHSRSWKDIQPITYRVKCQNIHQSFNCSFLPPGLLVNLFEILYLFFPQIMQANNWSSSSLDREFVSKITV